MNTVGSFLCECRVGFTVKVGDVACSDVDECDVGSDECSINAICRNTEGSYVCECNVGYRGDGRRCDGER